MKMTLPRLISIALITALTACSSGTESENTQLESLRDLRDTIKASRAGPKPLPPISRDKLNQLQNPILKVTIEGTGVEGLLLQHVKRTDASAGQIVVWRSGDNADVILRSGVLIGTRGLGNDVASGNAAMAVRALRNRQGGSGQRILDVRNDSNGLLRISMRCTMRVIGNETLSIVQKNFATKHMQEQCDTDFGTVTNDYWVDSRNGVVIKANQWAGPYLGKVGTTVLNN